jgi:uncharacterized membrane protein
MRDALLLASIPLTLLGVATAIAFQEVPPSSGHSLGSVTGGTFKSANVVIEKRCISCHSDKVIKDAIAAGKNMHQIQQRMEQKGAQLSADDRKVLGIFWQKTPLKQEK